MYKVFYLLGEDQLLLLSTILGDFAFRSSELGLESTCLDGYVAKLGFNGPLTDRVMF